MIKEDGTVIHFNNPKVQASVPANTFSVTGSAESKRKSKKEKLDKWEFLIGLWNILIHSQILI